MPIKIKDKISDKKIKKTFADEKTKIKKTLAKVKISPTEIREKHKHNLEIAKKRNKKFKNYAFFQFFASTAIFLLSLALGLIVYVCVRDQKTLQMAFFKTEFSSVLIFGSTDSLNIFCGYLTYIAFALWLLSMLFALLQIKNKQRSIFDSAFLLFFFVPLLSNVIALFCQISETVYRAPSELVDQYHTKIQYLEQLNKYLDKEQGLNKSQVDDPK